jgi:hypothetical protein
MCDRNKDRPHVKHIGLKAATAHQVLSTVRRFATLGSISVYASSQPNRFATDVIEENIDLTRAA